MIRTWQFGILAALAALIAARGSAPADAPAQEPTEFGRRLLRPLLLPRLWARFEAETLAADPAEMVAAGRMITNLMPGWTDGTVHVAWIQAHSLSRESEDLDDAVDRLSLALDWLEQAAEARLRAGAVDDAAELWLAAATMTAQRCDEDPAFADRLRQRLGRDGSELAAEALRRAVALVPDQQNRARLALATVRLIAGALRMGDLERAEAQRRRATQMLRELRDLPGLRHSLEALERLEPLPGYIDDRAACDALADDPELSELASALSALQR